MFFLLYYQLPCRKPDESAISLALVSLRCMCALLVSRPHFNYAANIAQSVVPHLDSRDPRARQAVTHCCTSVFADDNRGDITLTVSDKPTPSSIRLNKAFYMSMKILIYILLYRYI